MGSDAETKDLLTKVSVLQFWVASGMLSPQDQVRKQAAACGASHNQLLPSNRC